MGKRQCGKSFLAVVCCVAAISALCPRAFALVINPNTTGHDIAPSGGRGFDNVGQMSTGTGVYLGYGWVLTAHHVYDDVTTGHSIDLGGTWYNEMADTHVRLKNPDDSNADLSMFRISGNPGLATVDIRQTTSTVSTSVTMIATGLNQLASSTTWYVDTDPSPWVWDENFFDDADTTADGFKTSGTRTKLWGTNEVATVTTTGFWTVFENVDDDAQGVVYDSGGGAFTYNTLSGEWELAGIITAVGIPPTWSGEPDARYNALFFYATWMADLSLYRDQIMDTVPEPGTVLLLCAGGLIAVLRRRRRRTAA